ncbi:CHAD domain-containing protein [Hydrogenovibrio kuenenii]|uniref:CHAD domain-containing protein n=1 Tax=Hydrogenovibrio kuenenii TaxID=63658 RepID=UPI00046728DE|nr:CHAD domain-containing protein [Hydrogenovibrio kuenenii]
MEDISKKFIRRIFKNFGLKAKSSEEVAPAFMASVCQEVSDVLSLANDIEQREASKSIHAIRVTFKRLRAYWRLISPAITKEEFREANNRIRSTAKLLAQHRDLQVMFESLEQIESLMVEKSLSKETQAYLDELKSGFEAQIVQQEESLPDIDWNVIQKALKKELAAWQALSVEQDFMQTLQQGFQKTLSSCHRYALAGIAVGATSEDRHEWRKWVKHGYYQLKLLKSLGTDKGKKAIQKLDQLGNLLGKEHDFEILYLHLKAMSKKMKVGKSKKEAHKTLEKFTRQRLSHLKKQVNHLHSELLKSW